jgi:hypothetical protein
LKHVKCVRMICVEQAFRKCRKAITGDFSY